MSPTDRTEEMFFDLALAVTAGDLAKAQAALDLMLFAGPHWQQTTILRARRTVNPLPASEAPSALVLPIPGDPPGSYSLPSVHNKRPGGAPARSKKRRA